MARVPVYFATERAGIMQAWRFGIVATAGVIAGTLWGVHLLRRIPDRWFRPVVSILIAALGVYMLLRR